MTCRACYLKQEDDGLTLYAASRVAKGELIAVYCNRFSTGGNELGICRTHCLGLTFGCLSGSSLIIESKVNWDNPLQKFIDETKLGGFINSADRKSANATNP
mmetsp:Transcript_45633/g.121319  ORF Transcript_45633/g.121319 Transcript_45633/m.121319 type:complete len:102 (+) Transcript_45633:885-1190(+)